jgi:hypothetical protein
MERVLAGSIDDGIIEVISHSRRAISDLVASASPARPQLPAMRPLPSEPLPLAGEELIPPVSTVFACALV